MSRGEGLGSGCLFPEAKGVASFEGKAAGLDWQGKRSKNVLPKSGVRFILIKKLFLKHIMILNY